MPFAQLHDVRLHYRFDGNAAAPLLILSNSLGTDLTMWEPQMAALTREFRVLRYDTRGHGASQVTSGPYTIAQLGTDVTALLDHLGLKRGHFCGVSMGGMTGMWLGVHAPDRLRRLVLANTAARIPSAETWNARIERVNADGMQAIVDAVLARWFTPRFMADEPATLAKIRATLQATPAAGYVACCAAVRDQDQRDAIHDIAARTLVIAGTHDVATPPADSRYLAERIPGARMVELDGAHLSNIEAASAFNEALVTFLTT
jgi:3-oxoadipate enol-lactonase